MPSRKSDAPADPDALVRQAAGDYRSGDERFVVRQADVGWFLVDTDQANEFGQELIHGPYPNLKAVKAAIPGARAEKVVPMRRPAASDAPSATGSKSAKKRKKAKAEEPPPPPTWIDKLPLAEGRAVRSLIARLERDGVADAEDLVQRDRDGLLPAVAVRLISQRLAEIVDEAEPEERQRTSEVVQRVAEVLTTQGTTLSDPLPGWVLVEVGPDDEAPTHRRIDLRT